MHVYFMNARKDNVYLPPSYCNITQDRFNLGLPYVCAGIEIQKQNKTTPVRCKWAAPELNVQKD